ncbi:glutathione S-transferase family protein [Variibacter gotjawalensis]|uniref:glutathione S-transferase family protein n=1 Tax=Variibacter gotjawalensis TaxID=1333996 RepID=UPI001FDED8AB|nr:glutathione S-transferase C-terminal domain-containing protein [Variibacter gotjawalensis]
MALAEQSARRAGVTLYALPGACSLASHIALEWVVAAEPAIEDQVRVVMMPRDTFPTPQFRAKVAVPTVPALETSDGAIITESLAVLLHITDRFPKAELGPRQGHYRDELHRLLSFMASTAHPSFQMLWRPERFSDDPVAHASIKRQAVTRLTRVFSHLDSALGDGEWLLGSKPSVADFYLFVLGRWGQRLDDATHNYPNCWRVTEALSRSAIVHRVLAREGITFCGPVAGLG